MLILAHGKVPRGQDSQDSQGGGARLKCHLYGQTLANLFLYSIALYIRSSPIYCEIAGKDDNVVQIGNSVFFNLF